MDESLTSLLENAEKCATDIFINKVSKSITYHNLAHTQNVVASCEKIANYYQLNDEDRTVLLTAAWFHDTGYSSGNAEGHEHESIRLVSLFLKDQGINSDFIAKVASSIHATQMPQSPQTLVEEILCDADLFHLGSNDFKSNTKLLRQELNGKWNMGISKKDWRKRNIMFLEKHQYFTSFGKEKLQPQQEANLLELKSADKEDKKEDTKEKKEEKKTTVSLSQSTDAKKEAAEKKAKEQQTDRGISTVFRITSSNQANLSQMADNKANIIISVNAIILSVVISVLVRHLDEHPNLVIPTIILVITCVCATIFAILATRPNVSKGTFTREDIHDKKTNLLFFGNFHDMQIDDYDWAMKEMMSDRDYLYRSVIKDIYYLGVVLAKKYRYLRIAYNIFMFGLIISMMAFGITMAYDAFFAPPDIPVPLIR